MTTRWASALLATFVAVSALAGDAAAQGRLRLRKGHPRLLFTEADLPRLRELAKGEGRQFFGRLERYARGVTVPAKPQFLEDATDAQRQGFWKLPSVALHYVLTGDKQSFDRTVEFMKFLMALEHWETTRETDCGMGAANIMVGAALAYDWTHNELPPDFRNAFRRKLLLQAQRMYDIGHGRKHAPAHYWQQDPQNNHRFHRDAGLALCVFAAVEGEPGTMPLLESTIKELQFLHKWLPPDGTCHESPSYMPFGFQYLVLAFDASDRCVGTKLLQHPFFKRAPLFRIESLTPGLTQVFPYGDTGGKPGYYNNYCLRLTAAFGLKDEQAAVLAAYEADWAFLHYDWSTLIWYDPSLKGGSIDNLPKSILFPDLGVAYMRDGWQTDNVGMMFKCGPYGGHTLNKYRKQRGLASMNVAHDDPDANMFLIYTGGDLVAMDDGYAETKLTAAHNTILVNGSGQRGEGDGWTQPIPHTDMSLLANVVTWKNAGDVVVVEGEAAGMYTDLSRYRRAVIWAKGRYVLILDDIAATKPADLTWLIQSKKVETVDAATHRYALVNGSARCEFQTCSDKRFRAEVVDSPAEHKGASLGLRQLRLTTNGKRWRVATLLNPWHHKELTLAMRTSGATASIRVAGPEIADEWTWVAAQKNALPASFKGSLGKTIKVTVSSRDRAPRP